MTAQEAHKILHPDTSRDEIMKIEYYAGFRAEEAGLKAVQEACLVACEALEKQIQKKFPSMEEMAKDVAEKALDEYEYQGKTLRQWVDILKDYDNKQATLQRIVKRLQETMTKSYVTGITANAYEFGACHAMSDAIKIVREEGGI